MSTDTTGSTDDQNGPGTGPQSGQEAANGPGQGEGTPDGSQDDTAAPADQEGAGREAAGYRRRLRDTEQERDALRTQVETMQRQEVERVAGEHLSVGTDLLSIGGTALADVLDESGDVDPDAVRGAAAELARTRPGLRRPASAAAARATIGQGGTHTAPAAGRSGGWADALRGGR